MAGLDPAIHVFGPTVDARIKPGNNGKGLDPFGNGNGFPFGNGNGSTLQAGTGSSLTSVAYSVNQAKLNLSTGKVTVTGLSTTDTLIGGITIATVSGTGDTIIAGSGTNTLTALGTGDTLIGGAAGTTATLGSNLGGNALQSGAGTAIACNGCSILPEAISICVPPVVAIFAASTLVRMPPRESSDSASPATASISEEMLSTTGMSLAFGLFFGGAS